jgi:hypothetical protein
MMTPSFRDVEQLSAFLDGQLSQAENARLEDRIKADPELVAALEELRQARAILRRTPKRRVPRNFILTPRMAGLRPPVPHLVPALSWASAVAMLLFLFTLGSSLLSQLPSGAAAPMMATAPSGLGGAPKNETYGIGGSAADKATLTENGLQTTPTPENVSLQVPESTSVPNVRMLETQPIPETSARPVNPWMILWPGLAAVMIGAALLIRWAGVKKFRDKAKISK